MAITMGSKSQRIYQQIERLGAHHFAALFKAFVQRFDSNLNLIVGIVYLLYGSLLQHNEYGTINPTYSSLPCEYQCSSFELIAGSLFLVLFLITTTQSLLNQAHVKRDAGNRVIFVADNIWLDHMMAVFSFLLRAGIGVVLVMLIVRFSSAQSGFAECRADHAYNNIKLLISLGMIVFATSFIVNAVFGKFYGNYELNNLRKN